VKGENMVLKKKVLSYKKRIKILTTKNKILFKHARKWYRKTQMLTIHNRPWERNSVEQKRRRSNVSILIGKLCN
jgi:hypothetical protein